MFLLGAGINLCGRPHGAKWQFGADFLPDGRELASYLVRDRPFEPQDVPDLPIASMYTVVDLGEEGLSYELRPVFEPQYEPTSVHRLLAELPSRLRALGSPQSHLLIITTNYDDVLETAFRAVDPEPEPFDVFTYMASGEYAGRVWHEPWGEEEGRVIDEPNKAVDAGRDRTAILKIHGAINRRDPERDSWVITEEHYIEYLTNTDIARWMPVGLMTRLQSGHLECLGYSLRDWNMRAILHRLRKTRPGTNWWAVQKGSDEIQEYLWARHSLQIFDADLTDYVEGFQASLAAAV